MYPLRLQQYTTPTVRLNSKLAFAQRYQGVVAAVTDITRPEGVLVSAGSSLYRVSVNGSIQLVGSLQDTASPTLAAFVPSSLFFAAPNTQVRGRPEFALVCDFCTAHARNSAQATALHDNYSVLEFQLDGSLFHSTFLYRSRFGTTRCFTLVMRSSLPSPSSPRVKTTKCSLLRLQLLLLL